MAEIAGFDVLTLANNHTADFGPDALLDTIRYVRAAGIKSIGAGANDRSAGRPAVVEAGGLRIAFLGFSDINPFGFSATATTPGTARADPEAMARRFAPRAGRPTLSSASCTGAWSCAPTRLAQAAARVGVLRRRRAGRARRAPARARADRAAASASSLSRGRFGNFVFPSAGVTARSGILQVRLDARGVRGYRLLPVEIDGFRPR